jgi:eukaryotic-like serine/threonine-protein kinase
MRKKYNKIFFNLLIIIILIAGCAGIQIQKYVKPRPGDWTMYGGNCFRTNFSEKMIVPPLKPVWEYDANAAFSEYSLVVADSIIFVGNLKGEMHLVGAVSGKKISKQSFDEAIVGAPVVEANVIYFPVNNGNVNFGEYDLSAGKFSWTLKLSEIETSPLVFGSQIFVTTHEGKLVAVDKHKGIVNWTFQDSKDKKKSSRSSAATDGKVVVFGNDNGNLYAVDVDNGKLFWKFKTGGSIVATPSIYNQTVLFGSTDGYFYALDISDGIIRWKTNFSSPIYSSQAVADSFVYIGGSDCVFRCLNINTGELKWSFKAGSVISSAPLVTKNFVFVGSLDKNLYVLDTKNGNLIWSYLLNGRIKSTPVLWNEYLYVLTDDHIITAFIGDRDEK